MVSDNSLSNTFADETASLDAATAMRCAAAGIGAFVVNYLLTVVLWTQSELPRPDSLGDLFQQAVVSLVRDAVTTWKAAGMVLFNGHFVDLGYRGSVGSGSFNLIDLAGGGLLELTYLVPPVTLLVAGFLVARSSGLAADLSDSAVSGALLAGGYLVLALAGSVVFAYSSGDVSLSVPVMNVLVVAGVVYPVLFGALGGLVAHFAD
jgi:hypothetical protein